MSPRPGRNVLVVIGIDRYEHWDRLHNAVSDARGARKLFVELGFQEVVPPLLDGAATRAALDELVHDTLVNDANAALRPDDSLVIFYAGHGGVRETIRNDRPVRIGHLIPVDAAEDRFSTWTNLEAWLRAVALLPPRHILVILDACFCGIALGSLIRWRGRPAPTEALAALQARPSRRVLTSALEDERAQDSGPIAEHSLFTGALIEALSGGIASSDGAVTGSELATWVRRRIRSFPGAQQTPDFGAFDHDERGEIAIPLKQRADDASLVEPVELPGRPPARIATPRRSRWLAAWRRRMVREREWWFAVAALLAATIITATGLREC